MKAHTPLFLAAVLLAALPAVAEPPVMIPLGAVNPTSYGERESPFARGRAMPIRAVEVARGPGYPVFVAPYFEQDEADFVAALPQACFRHGQQGRELPSPRIPARLRHATVGEVLQYWESYCRFSGNTLKEHDRAELQGRDSAEVLPHVWVVEPPAPVQPGTQMMQLMFPGLGDCDAATGTRHELPSYRFTIPAYHRYFKVERLAPGRYRLKLHATHPMDAAELDACLQAASFYCVPAAIRLTKLDQLRPLTRQEDGSYAGEGLRLRLDVEASKACLQELELSGGRRARGYNTLMFEAEWEGTEALSVYTSLNLPSAYGRDVVAEPMGVLGSLLFCAQISPDVPEVGQPAPPAVVPEAAPASDLVLLQLPGKHDVVAFACRLSSGAPLAEGKLELLDASGTPLATYPVADGLVQGELPRATESLRLSCGEETLVQKVDWGGYEAKPHPHAPDFTNTWARATGICDRRAYRAGDVVRLCGFIREFHDRQVHFPKGVRAELRYELPEADGTLREHRQAIDVAEDGSYMCAFRLADDMHGIKHMQATVMLHGRSFGRCIGIPIQDNPIPALQMEGAFSLQGRELHALATVQVMDGTPLAGRGLRWELSCKLADPTPRGYEEYCFGDHRPDPPLPAELRSRRDASSWQKIHSTLDSFGCSEACFTLPELPFPRRMELELVADSGYAYTDNGMRYTERLRLDPAALYVGLRRESSLSPVGSRLPLSLLLVDAQGMRYAGEPVEVEVIARFHRVEPGRFGTGLRLAPAGEETFRHQLMLPAEGTCISLPLEEAGAYDILVQGRDAEGKTFASAIRQYAWEADTPIPWEMAPSPRLDPVPDKKRYRVGDTARLLLPGAVEGEATIMVQGPDSRRFLRLPVAAGSRWLSIPLLMEDGPSPRLEIILVQSRALRPAHGRPAVQRGSCRLSVEADPGHRLSVRLNDLPDTLHPGEHCEVSGCVRDAAGEPVAHATVFLYAQNVGVTARFSGLPRTELSVQEQGEERFSRAFLGVRELPSLPSPRGNFLPQWHYLPGAALDSTPAAPENGEADSPLWQRIRTDANGCFRTHISAPDMLADYHLVALASGRLPTQFGADGLLLHVENPLTLRAQVPPCVHVGDQLSLPLYLRLAKLPAGAPERTRWRLRLVEQSGASCPQPEQDVELSAGNILPLHLPVRLDAEGAARLRWKLEPAEGQPALEGMSASLTTTFTVLPVAEAEPQPRLSRRYERRLEDGSWEAATHFQQGDIVRITIEQEGQRHVEEDSTIRDYLPTGWEPVLHAFTDDCAASWVPSAIWACRDLTGWTERERRRGADWLSCKGAMKGHAVRLCYLARASASGEFTAPPARAEGAVEGSSAPAHLVVHPEHHDDECSGNR